MLRLADIGSRLAFGRAFSPLAELHLVGQGWTLASGTIGRGEAALVVGSALVLLALVGVALYGGSGAWRRSRTPRGRWLLRTAAALLVAGLAALLVQGPGGPDLGVRADVPRELAERVRAARRAVLDQAEFSALLADDPVGSGRRRRASPRSRGSTSSCCSSSPTGGATSTRRASPRRARRGLDEIEAGLGAAGLHARSAWLDSPVRGGRSWLAQATLVSGLPLTDHARFDRLLGSERRSLHRLFADAGWTSAAVLPIVDGVWAEGAWYGVERFFDRGSLGYAGKGFGYVPMPDQYTLAAFQRHVRETAEGPADGERRAARLARAVDAAATEGRVGDDRRR